MSSTLFWFFPIPQNLLVSPLFYLFFGAEIFIASGVSSSPTLMYMAATCSSNFLWPLPLALDLGSTSSSSRSTSCRR